jgi:hypothetical protein
VRHDPSTMKAEIFEEFWYTKINRRGSSTYTTVVSFSLTYHQATSTFIHYINTLSSQAQGFKSLSISNTTTLSSQQRLHSLTLSTTNTQCVSNSSLFPYWLLSQRPLPSPASLAVSAQPAQSPSKTPMQPSHQCYPKCPHKAPRLS